MQTPGGTMASPTGEMQDAHDDMGVQTPSLSDCREVEEGRVSVVAQDLAYDTDCIEADAGEAFVITLDNRDGAPHNILIEDQSGQVVFDGENVTQDSIDYEVPALDAGEYPFHCHVHPQMTGVLVVD